MTKPATEERVAHTPQQIAKLKELADSATAGPWEKWQGNPEVYCQVKANECGRIQGYAIATCESDDLPELDEQYLEEDSYELQAEANAEFIAAANPSTILSLLAERTALVDALRALPLDSFDAEDMGKCDAADFVDHAGEFFNAMVKARAALSLATEQK